MSLAKFISSLACVFFVLISLHSFAYEEIEPQDLYQIEYVIFKHLDFDKSEVEFEDHSPLILEEGARTHLISGFSALVDNQKTKLSLEEMAIGESIIRLRDNRSTEVLDFGAWIQAIDNDQTLAPLEIKKYLPANSISDTVKLEGIITIKRSRYMHAKFEFSINSYLSLPYENLLDWFYDDDSFPAFWLVQPLALQDTYLENKGLSLSLFSSLKMNQSRRIKDKETHYLDHPVLGAIVTIWKIEPDPLYTETGQSDG